MLPLNPADPYDEILDPSKNLLAGVEAQPWDKVHTGITLVGSIPNSTLGEKVLHELLLASMDRMGIFTLGRVEMYMFCYKDAVKVNKRLSLLALSLLFAIPILTMFSSAGLISRS